MVKMDFPSGELDKNEIDLSDFDFSELWTEPSDNGFSGIAVWGSFVCSGLTLLALLISFFV